MDAPDGERKLIDRYQALVEHSADVISLVDADGSIRYQSPSVERVLGYGPDELLGASLCDYFDPADRERELAEEREKYATVVEQSNDAVLVMRDWTVLFANRQAHELLGYDDLVGMSNDEIVAPEDHELVRGRYEQRLDPAADDPPERYEVRLVTRDGEAVVGEVNVASITYEGKPARLVTIRDVTDRVRFEERLESVAEELEALNRVVRHDIRNDMTVILGWARLLEAHVDEEGRDQLEHIIASGERVVELTDVARDYVESLTGDAGPETKPVPLGAVIELELTLRQETYPEATFVGPGAVPDVQVRANEMLASVFRNLLNNAVQHHDGDEPRVEVTVDVEDDAAVVAVADDGPGIPAERRGAVFGKGERGDDSDGTGIGLYLVRSLVEGYGGSVRVEANEPRGTRFVVVLPLAA